MTDRIRRRHRFAVVPEPFIKDTAISDRAFRLWCLLDRYAGANEAAFPSRTTLALDLGCSRASIDRALAELVNTAWLSKQVRHAGGTNMYTLLDASDRNPQFNKAPRLTGESGTRRRNPSSPMQQGVITSDAPPDSPVTHPLITGDAQKEASSTDASPNDARRDGVAEAPPSDRTRRGTRLPADWEPDEMMRQWFREQPFAHLFSPWEETQRFKDHWAAQPGQRGVKIDWAATWRNWMRTTADRVRPPRASGTSNVHHLPATDSDRIKRESHWAGSGS